MRYKYKLDYLNEAWLDDNQEFYDYHTASVNGADIFDTSKTGFPYYDSIIDDREYMRNAENVDYKIEMLSPEEYYERCAKDVFNSSAQRLKMQRRVDKRILDHLKQVIIKYKRKFPLPYINYATFSHAEQEGLHRMMVAGDLFGWDTKFPVMIINWADKNKAQEMFENKRRSKIESYMRAAVRRSVQYNYYNLDEFKDQLISDLERELEYEPEFENKEFQIELLDTDSEIFELILNQKYHTDIEKSRVKLITHIDPDDDLDLDDDIISDWLKELLGEK